MSGLVVLAPPLHQATEGRLVIRGGLRHATLNTDATMTEICTVRTTGCAPRARCSGGTVELAYPVSHVGFRRNPDDIVLNGTIPWQIDVVGGIADVRADLTGAAVRSIDVDGPVTRCVLDLPRPDGTVRITAGVVSDVTIRRPAGVPLRVLIAHSARRVTLDDEALATTAGSTAVATPCFDGAPHRVELAVESADRLTAAAAAVSFATRVGNGEVLLAAQTWLARFGMSGVVWPAPGSHERSTALVRAVGG